MNTFSAPAKTSILVVENEKEHFAQMVAHLSDDFDLQLLKPSEEEDALLNFKALHPFNQIVIVDLDLRRKAGGNADEGYKLIERLLWPADRTTFFVIFTQHPDKKNAIDLEDVGPNVTFVPKRMEPGTRVLLPACLDRLRKIVSQFRELSTVPIEVPHHDAAVYHSDFRTTLYLDSLRDLQERITRSAIAPLEHAHSILNQCSQAASTFSRAGAPTAKCSIAIYGSIGRLEPRPNSDVEFSVFYEGDGSPGPLKDVAIILWNRLMKFIDGRGWQFEGHQLVKKRKPPILIRSDVSGALPNGYVPVIPFEKLIGANLRKEPQVRNRCLQILTETRAVFNPQLLLSQKIRLLRTMTGLTGQSVPIADILAHRNTEDLLNQFAMDTRPGEMTSFKDYKAFVYRLLHLLSIRLALVMLDGSHTRFLKEPAEWLWFFDVLSAPGVLKVLRFINFSQMHPHRSESEKLKATSRRVLHFYLDAIERLWLLSEEPQQAEQEFRKSLTPAVRDCGKHFVELFKLIQHDPMFGITDKVSSFLKTEDFEAFLKTV
jgi:hypothetical protein